MARYIDADRLIADGWVLERHGISNKLLQVMSIADVPTADVVEVKHGEWEQGDYYDIGDVCSVCQYDSRLEPCKYNYCPNCGAKMDGGK